jgi:hypothetical protein
MCKCYADDMEKHSSLLYWFITYHGKKCYSIYPGILFSLFIEAQQPINNKEARVYWNKF